MDMDDPIPRPIFGRTDEARVEFIATRGSEPRYLLMGRLVALELVAETGTRLRDLGDDPRIFGMTLVVLPPDLLPLKRIAVVGAPGEEAEQP